MKQLGVLCIDTLITLQTHTSTDVSTGVIHTHPPRDPRCYPRGLLVSQGPIQFLEWGSAVNVPVLLVKPLQVNTIHVLGRAHEFALAFCCDRTGLTRGRGAVGVSCVELCAGTPCLQTFSCAFIDFTDA